MIEGVPMSGTQQLSVRFDDEGVAWLSGELDLATADSLFEAVQATLDGHQLVLDFSDLTFVDSTGIRAILRLAQAKHQTVVLRHLPENIRRVFTIAGIDENAG